MPSGVRIASGLTPRQEMYCQLLARGQNLSDAYRGAYQHQGSANTINDSASKLWSRPESARGSRRSARAGLANDERQCCDQQAFVSSLLAERQDMKNKGSERIVALVYLGRIDTVSMSGSPCRRQA